MGLGKAKVRAVDTDNGLSSSTLLITNVRESVMYQSV